MKKYHKCGNEVMLGDIIYCGIPYNTWKVVELDNEHYCIVDGVGSNAGRNRCHHNESQGKHK